MRDAVIRLLIFVVGLQCAAWFSVATQAAIKGDAKVAAWGVFFGVVFALLFFARPKS